MAAIYRCPIVRAGAVGAYYELVLAQPELAASARPGQFLHIACGEGNLLRRPISICDAADGCVRLIFAQKGSGTAWLAARRAGESLDVLGPLGNGFSIPDGPILVVGGGVGVPPMLLTAKKSGRADAVLGFRSRELLLLNEEFADACETVYLMSDDGSVGTRGYAADGVRTALSRRTYAAVLACGPKPMLRGVAQAAAEAGIPCAVSLEERMGCGVGACLVCAVKLRRDGSETYLRVCRDGPVFPAEEVVWDD